jgi:hypothetical protein
VFWELPVFGSWGRGSAVRCTCQILVSRLKSNQTSPCHRSRTHTRTSFLRTAISLPSALYSGLRCGIVVGIQLFLRCLPFFISLLEYVRDTPRRLACFSAVLLRRGVSMAFAPGIDARGAAGTVQYAERHGPRRGYRCKPCRPLMPAGCTVWRHHGKVCPPSSISSPPFVVSVQSLCSFQYPPSYLLARVARLSVRRLSVVRRARVVCGHAAMVSTNSSPCGDRRPCISLSALDAHLYHRRARLAPYLLSWCLPAFLMSAPSWYHGVTSCIVGALALVVRSMAEGLAGKGGVAGAAYAQQILGLAVGRAVLW